MLPAIHTPAATGFLKAKAELLHMSETHADTLEADTRRDLIGPTLSAWSMKTSTWRIWAPELMLLSNEGIGIDCKHLLLAALANSHSSTGVA